MTTRHRFLGRLGDMCGNSFGGVAKCNLPYSNSEWHYSDDDHPFSSNPDYPTECNWSLQEGVWNGKLCTGDAGDDMHTVPPPENPRTGEPVTLVMEYPKQEQPEEKTVAAEWGAGHVYPPDEDGGERVGAGVTERFEVPPNFPTTEAEARQYRWDNHEGGPSGPTGGGIAAKLGATGDAQPEWSRAVGWLKEDGASLLYGPWPMRKFVLRDMQQSGTADSIAMAEQVRALNLLDKDYSITVYRPQGMPWRVAWLTWDWAFGYTIEVACDELATVYG